MVALDSLQDVHDALQLGVKCGKAWVGSDNPTWQPPSLDSSSGGTTLYVSPSGSDSNPGTLSKPFKTIAFGVAAARKQATQPVTLALRAGTYYLQDTIQLGAEDAGGLLSWRWRACMYELEGLSNACQHDNRLDHPELQQRAGGGEWRSVAVSAVEALQCDRCIGVEGGNEHERRVWRCTRARKVCAAIGLVCHVTRPLTHATHLTPLYVAAHMSSTARSSRPALVRLPAKPTPRATFGHGTTRTPAPMPTSAGGGWTMCGLRSPRLTMSLAASQARFLVATLAPMSM